VGRGTPPGIWLPGELWPRLTEGISIAMIFLLLFIFKININKPDGGINSLINIQWGNNKTIAYGIFLLMD
jgi:hypothetical protein